MAALSELDAAAVTRALSPLGPLDERELADMLRLFRVRELDRNECLLRAGERAALVGVVVSGLMREFFVTPGGVERTKNFSPPGQWTGSLSDLLSAGPARAFIVAEERTRLALMRYDELLALESRFPVYTTLMRRSAERLLLVKAEREYELICLDAEARYQAFRARYGALEARLSGRHVASYLGITPVHLSRLRRRRSVVARIACR
jgi:CRP-like cAMP-binding protein